MTQIALHIDRSRFEPHVASYKAEGMRFEELRAQAFLFFTCR